MDQKENLDVGYLFCNLKLQTAVIYFMRKVLELNFSDLLVDKVLLLWVTQH